MENASKALIIAGAILLSILIISLGIMIFTQASSVVDNNAMDEVAVTTFNEKFRQYEGNSVRGANVNALIQRIAQNNLTNADDESKRITLVFGSGEGKKITSTSEVDKAQTGKTYTVKSVSDSKSGYITKIEVTLNSDDD